MAGPLEIDYVAMDSIKPHSHNPRLGDIRAIAESLKAYSQYKPIVVRSETNEILAGNQTYAAAKLLEWDEIAVVYVSVSDVDAKRIVIADNRTHDLGAYNDPLLANLLRDVMEEDVDLLDGTGYTEDDVDQLLAQTVTEIDIATEVDPEEIGHAVGALDRLLPPTSSQRDESHFVADGDGTDLTSDSDDELAGVDSPSVAEDVPKPDPVKVEEFVLMRIGHTFFKVDRSVYQDFYEDVKKESVRTGQKASVLIGQRLGFQAEEIKPPTIDGSESWKG